MRVSLRFEVSLTPDGELFDIEAGTAAIDYDPVEARHGADEYNSVPRGSDRLLYWDHVYTVDGRVQGTYHRSLARRLRWLRDPMCSRLQLREPPNADLQKTRSSAFPGPAHEPLASQQRGAAGRPRPSRLCRAGQVQQGLRQTRRAARPRLPDSRGLRRSFRSELERARQITALHLPGDMADLHSVVQPEATSALQALSTATILCVPHDAVRRTAVAHPALAEALWRDCMVDASILAQWVVNVGRRDARARIAHVLCEVALRVGAAPAKGEIIFPFPVTQTQLADVTGLTAVHVNRTLQGLRAEGLADVKGNARIHDWDGLVVAGDFDPDYLQMNVKPQRRLPLPLAN